jgi:hypothetical protein
VDVTGAWVPGSGPAGLLYGTAALSITDNRAGEETLYWCESVHDGGELVGLRLTPFCRDHVIDETAAVPHRAGQRYYVHLRGNVSCDCADATYRPDRPGGCKHVNAVRQALGLVAAHGWPRRAEVPFADAEPACCATPAAPPAVNYVATVAGEVIDQGTDLDALLASVAGIHEPADDVVVWRHGRVVVVLHGDGRRTYPAA